MRAPRANDVNRKTITQKKLHGVLLLCRMAYIFSNLSEYCAPTSSVLLYKSMANLIFVMAECFFGIKHILMCFTVALYIQFCWKNMVFRYG